MSKVRIIYMFIIILIILPNNISIASEFPSIYGITIHLKNNDKLEGYIETFWNLNTCNQNKKDRATWASFLENQRERFKNESKDKVTVTFIDKLIEIKYDKTWVPFAAKSSVKEIKIDNIRNIEGVCKNRDGYPGSISIITDYMVEYISNHKLIALYIYDEDALLKAGKMEEDCGLCACVTTYLSYNPKYTREILIKNRKVIDKMPNDILDKERLIKFTKCWD